MIFFDEANKQILSRHCAACCDPDFTPKRHRLFHVGCCGHSPVFSLFEIGQMVAAKAQQFFWEEIYRHPGSEVRPFSIRVRANVHARFFEQDLSGLAAVERDDLKREFSVCPYFAEGQGCRLLPRFKPSLCRAFICTTLEEGLDEAQKSWWLDKMKEIRAEAARFNERHEAELKRRKLNLIDDANAVLGYLERMLA